MKSSEEMGLPSTEKEGQGEIEQELMILAAWGAVSQERNLEQFVKDFNKKHSTGEPVDPKQVLRDNISPEADASSVFTVLYPTYFDPKSGRLVRKNYIFHIPTKTLLEVSEEDLNEYFEKSIKELDSWEDFRTDEDE